MPQRSTDLPAIEAEIERIRSLGLDPLRARWRSVFGAMPPMALTKDLIARMMIYRIQEEAFGGLDRSTRKLLDGMAQGENPGTEVKRRLKAGTVLVREYQGERHTVTVVADGFVCRGPLMEASRPSHAPSRAPPGEARGSSACAAPTASKRIRSQTSQPPSRSRLAALAHLVGVAETGSARSRHEWHPKEGVPMRDLYPQVDRA